MFGGQPTLMSEEIEVDALKENLISLTIQGEILGLGQKETSEFELSVLRNIFWEQSKYPFILEDNNLLHITGNLETNLSAFLRHGNDTKFK